MEYQGTSGNDNFSGTNKADIFYLTGGGADIVQGAGGNDNVLVEQLFDKDCRFDGGKGSDSLDLPEVPDGYTFNSTNFVNFESVAFFSQGATRATLAAECCPVGHDMTIYLPERDSDLDASAVSGNLTAYLGYSGHVRFTSGSGDDILYSQAKQDYIDAGAGNDSIEGADGRDTLTGGAGRDTFIYYYFHGYNEIGKDIITDFDVSDDTILITSHHLHRYSQLRLQDDGAGGTIVFFHGRQSADLEHVAFGTIAKSNFIFAQPSDQSHLSEAEPQHTAFNPSTSQAMITEMAGPHLAFDGLHVIAQAAIA